MSARTTVRPLTEQQMRHQHEEWQIDREDPDRPYCKACGGSLAPVSDGQVTSARLALRDLYGRLAMLPNHDPAAETLARQIAHAANVYADTLGAYVQQQEMTTR